MTPQWRHPLSDLDFGDGEREAVDRVLSSGWLSMGPEVAAFEQEFAAAIGVQHAIALSSATAALHLSLLTVAGAGDEVVQPALNFVACANVTRAVGAVPVFADIASPYDPTIDAATVKPLLTDRTRAVVAMHYGGTPARVGELRGLCRERDIPLIEDACHAVGATYGSAAPGAEATRVGALADLACFSFFSNKNLATGEGGMVTTNDDALASRLRLLRSHGMTTLTWDRHVGHAQSYDVVESGLNYRMDELRAALGRAQLRTLDERNRVRARAQDRYRARLGGLDRWTVLYADDDRPTSSHLCVALAPDRQARDAASAALRDAGIQTSIHYPPVTGFTAFADTVADVPVTEEFAQRTLSLPMHSRLTDSDVDDICAALLEHVEVSGSAG